LIQVSSALPGEGKTFCAINLAISIAMEVDHSVLLVDGDVIQPSVLRCLELAEDVGLLDVLRDPGMDLSKVMLRTNLPKLTLLPAGTASSDSTELLASTAMERLLDDLATNYSDRIVIFDSPPLLPTTESRVLASRMGQVLVVVESNSTRQADVMQAFAALESCSTVMSILNKHRTPLSNAYAGYGFGGTQA
jgi:receptor protein-tyrosine kinase